MSLNLKLVLSQPQDKMAGEDREKRYINKILVLFLFLKKHEINKNYCETFSAFKFFFLFFFINMNICLVIRLFTFLRTSNNLCKIFCAH